MAQECLLGIDGGASKTVVVLLGTDGQILARARGPGSAIVGEPSEQSCAVLRGLVHEGCVAAGLTIQAVKYCGIGLNGIDFPDEHAVQLEGIAGAIGLPQDKVTLVNDGIVALWGACAAESAAIVQHGSGFTAAWRRAYGEETLFDHLNAGGVFDMRHELACAVARMIDGRLDVTPLKEIALAHYGIEDEASFAERLFRGRIPADRRRSTPPLVYRAWLDGDPVAARIVERAADDYATAAGAMVAKVGAPDTHVALGGGVIQQGPDRFRNMIASRIHARYPDATVAAPALLPEYGAALMAAHHVGLDVKELFGKLVRLAPAHGNQGNAHA